MRQTYFNKTVFNSDNLNFWLKYTPSMFLFPTAEATSYMVHVFHKDLKLSFKGTVDVILSDPPFNEHGISDTQ